METMQLSRTAKGQEEIFDRGHTLRPRHRQILFGIGNGISFADLCNKFPHCAEFKTMIDDLLQGGFIEATCDSPAVPLAAPAAAEQSPDHLEAGRGYVLEFMAALVGTKSPAYRQMSAVQDRAGFDTVLPMCRRVVAAVASPHQAAQMGEEAEKRMRA